MNKLSAVFADSSYFIAILNSKDQWHLRAVAWQRWFETNQIPLVTTDMILWEFLNFFSGSNLRMKAYQAYVQFGAYRRLEIAPASLEAEHALQIYHDHSDKAWSLTDCLSFHVMRRRQIEAVLTTDHHFEQAGFQVILLREPGNP